MKKAASRSQAGFSLVEVALALGVASFCLIPLLGLLPVGVNTNQTSLEQTGAVNVALAVVSDLRAIPLTNPSTSQTSPVYGIPVPATPPGAATLFVRQDGTLSGVVNQDANPTLMPRYRVSLSFASSAPAGAAGNSNYAMSVRVLVSWPAVADPGAAAVPSRFSGSFETVTALVRN